MTAEQIAREEAAFIEKPFTARALLADGRLLAAAGTPKPSQGQSFFARSSSQTPERLMILSPAPLV